MVPRTSYPPTHHHHSSTTTVPPTIAQQTLSTFLHLTQSKPHLHPDSYLSSTGIKFSAHSGPNGGLAIHHLKRIEAGLRGQNLVLETQEELARFDSTAAGGDEEGDGELPEGDDRKLDSLLRLEHEKDSGKAVQGGRQGKKRKRATVEEIQDWAETSSQAADAPQQELESFANTPLHVMITEEDGWQDQREYELEQEEWTGEVGGEEREGAAVVRQGGGVPALATAAGTRDLGGWSGKSKTDTEKAKKKAAKKARREAERRAKGVRSGMG